MTSITENENMHFIQSVVSMDSTLMNQNVRNNLIKDCYVLKSVMEKFIKKKIKFPQTLIKDYRNIPVRDIIIIKNFYYEVMKIFVKDNKNYELTSMLSRSVKSEYNKYKYIGDDKICQVDSLRSDICLLNKETVIKFISCKTDKDISFIYEPIDNKLQWMNKKCIYDIFKSFRKHVKNNEIYCQECNNTEHMLNGIIWYQLVIKFTQESKNVVDRGSLSIFDFLVNGIVFSFSKKENRDNMFNYLNK